MLYATYNDKRWGLPPMTGSKADLAIATRLLSASDADRFRFLLPRSRFAEVRGVGRGITRRPGAADGLSGARLCLLVPSSCVTVVVSAMHVGPFCSRRTRSEQHVLTLIRDTGLNEIQ